MSQTGVVSWSKTAASNGTADSNVNWQEGMAPSAVNDSARNEMASVAKYRDDQAGSLLTAGTSTAYTLTTNQVFSSLSVLNGQKLKVRFHAANGATPTLSVDGLTAKPIYITDATAVGTGVIGEDSIWSLTYDNSAGVFILSGVPASVQDGTVNTASIANSAVSLAKIASIADQRILGNVSGSSAAPAALSFVGPTASGSTLSFPFPPSALFTGLAIKVTANTTATCAADQVVMTDSTGYVTKALSATLDMTTSGANGLDTGSRVAATWYYVFAIYNATSNTVACLASTSRTSPTMPSGYTFKARIGALRTAPGNPGLMGTYQYGRRAQYVVGLAQTGTLPLIDSGAKGTYDAISPTLGNASVTTFVPTPGTAATMIHVLASSNTNGGTTRDIIVAPSTSYGGTNNGPFGSNNMGYPIYISNAVPAGVSAWLTLEGNNIAWASSGSNTAIWCAGWEDNL